MPFKCKAFEAASLGVTKNLRRGLAHLADTQKDYKPVTNIKCREVSGLKKFYAKFFLVS
jgi:hypothetical protein